MALQVINIEREFHFNDTVLSDVNPSMTPENVLDFYASSYPELTTATISGPVIQGTKAVYTFEAHLGNKG